MTPPVVLTIAGSDSGAGAGIQADLKTFAALGVFGTTAITAITAQNTATVAHVHVLPTEVVAQQVLAVTSDFGVRAVKTGMLATAEIIQRVAALAAEGLLPNLVVDPVMVSSTGARLLDDDAGSAYLDVLFPYATIITPNLREAAVLTGCELADIDDMAGAARRLHAAGAANVLIKGGHLDGEAVDVFYGGDEVQLLTAPRVDTANTHGSGCSLAAATAARLAHGDDIITAVTAAKAFVHSAIEAAADWRLGTGHGPLHHLFRSQP